MPSATANQDGPAPAPPRRRSRKFRVLRALLLVAFVLLLIVAAAPWLISRTLLRGQIESRIAAEVGAAVTVADCSLSWLDGIAIDGLRVANPPGFPQERPMLALARLRGGVSWSKLVGGRLSLDLHAKGLAVGVEQKADGTTNLEEAQRRSERAKRPASKPPSGGKGPADPSLAWLGFDVTLEDSSVVVRHEQRGVIETLTAIRARAKKDLGSESFRCELACALPKGRVALEATVDPTLASPTRVKLASAGVDLARYKPLLAPFVQPDDVTRLEGTLSGDLELDVDLRANRVTSRGSLAVDGPAVAGGLLRGATLAAQRWELVPNVGIALADGSAGTPDPTGVHVDLGLLQADGLPAAESSRMLGGRAALGVAFTLDLAALAAIQGPIPAQMAGTSGTVRGKLAVALPARLEEWRDTAKLATSLALRLEAAADGVRVAGGQAPAAAAASVAVTMDQGWERPFGVTFRASELDLAECERLAGTRYCEGKIGLDGDATVELGKAPYDQDRIQKALRVDAKIAATSARICDQRVEGYEGTLKIAAGKLELSGAPGKTMLLNGGPADLALLAELDRQRSMPASVRIDWHGGTVATGAVPVLQYFLPVLAGIAHGANVDFGSKIDTTMGFRGPLLASEGKSTLEWLNLWTGSGDLHLLEGEFTPAPALASLLEVLGAKRRLAFKKLGGKFEIVDGFVQTTLAECEGTLKKLGIRGRTSLSGQIDYRIDVTALLEGHRDGEKIKKALGKAPLEAGLVGTLSQPRLTMPDLPKLLLQGALEGLLRK